MPSEPKREAVNAPLDPFGNVALDAAQLTSLFGILKAKWLVSSSGPLPKNEKLEGVDCFFKPESPPRAVIFISHRWETTEQPDPTARQADAIRYFLNRLEEVHHGTIPRPFWRRCKLKSLLTYGAIHATYFYADAIRFGGDVADDWKAGMSDAESRDILSTIGVWYDYSSMPQESVSERLVECLARMHELIGESTMLVLRYPSDDYEDRAWCALELATEPDIERRQCKKLSLSFLFNGTPIHPDNFRDNVLLDFLDMMKSWPKKPSVALTGVRGFFRFQTGEREHEVEIPLYTPRRKPSIFRGQRTFMLFLIDALERLSAEDSHSDRISSDIVPIVIAAMKTAGLQTTHEDDKAYTGLMILYARHRGAPEMARFYTECIQRVISKRTTCLVRYRERRTESSVRVWFAFADDTGPFRPPDWS